VEQKQAIVYPGDLFTNEFNRKALPHSEDCEVVYGAEAGKGLQAKGAGEQERALVSHLMAAVCLLENISRAFKQGLYSLLVNAARLKSK